MPCFDNPLARFVITTWRGGDVFDAQVARDGERAAAIAITMLAALAAGAGLMHGDRLDVIEAPSEELPEPSRASHMGG